MDFKVLLKNRWLLALGILGLICLLVGSVWNGKPTAAPAMASSGTQGTDPSSGPASASSSAPGGTNSIASIEASDDTQMEQMLSNLVGVNHVSVMANVTTTNLLTLANTVKKTTETTVTGNKQTHNATTTDTQPFTQTVGGDSLPVVIHSTSPQVTGVLVLVNAQDFYVAKAEIIDAITNVWDVPAYNISVEPEK